MVGADFLHRQRRAQAVLGQLPVGAATGEAGQGAQAHLGDVVDRRVFGRQDHQQFLAEQRLAAQAAAIEFAGPARAGGHQRAVQAPRPHPIEQRATGAGGDFQGDPRTGLVIARQQRRRRLAAVLSMLPRRRRPPGSAGCID